MSRNWLQSVRSSNVRERRAELARRSTGEAHKRHDMIFHMSERCSFRLEQIWSHLCIVHLDLQLESGWRQNLRSWGCIFVGMDLDDVPKAGVFCPSVGCQAVWLTP